MSIADSFINRVAPALKQIIGTVRGYTSLLKPKDDWVEEVRRKFCLIFDPIFRSLGRPLIFECHNEDFICTVGTDSNEVEGGLYPKYQRNLTSTRKYRVIGGERQWANGSWVYDPDDTQWQHHVYLFDNGDGVADVYGHKETSAEKDPYGHVTDGQDHGDPDGIVRGRLERAAISFEEDEQIDRVNITIATE